MRMELLSKQKQALKGPHQDAKRRENEQATHEWHQRELGQRLWPQINKDADETARAHTYDNAEKM